MGSSTSQSVSAGAEARIIERAEAPLFHVHANFNQVDTKFNHADAKRKFDHPDAKFNHGGAKFNFKNRGEIQGKEQGRILETLWRWRPAQAISEAL